MRVLELKVIKKLYKNKKLIMKINMKKQIDEDENQEMERVIIKKETMEQVAAEKVAAEKVAVEEEFKKI